jgi:hypothetical protein
VQAIYTEERAEYAIQSRAAIHLPSHVSILMLLPRVQVILPTMPNPKPYWYRNHKKLFLYREKARKVQARKPPDGGEEQVSRSVIDPNALITSFRANSERVRMTASKKKKKKNKS